MPIYLLTPQRVDAPTWRRSNHRAPLQVEAENEQQARVKATRKYCPGIVIGKGSERPAPWQEPEFCTAKVVAARDPNVPFVGAKD